MIAECKTSRGCLTLSVGSVGCAQEGLYTPFWSHPIQDGYGYSCGLAMYLWGCKALLTFPPRVYVLSNFKCMLVNIRNVSLRVI